VRKEFAAQQEFGERGLAHPKPLCKYTPQFLIGDLLSVARLAELCN